MKSNKFSAEVSHFILKTNSVRQSTYLSCSVYAGNNGRYWESNKNSNENRTAYCINIFFERATKKDYLSMLTRLKVL